MNNSLIKLFLLLALALFSSGATSQSFSPTIVVTGSNSTFRFSFTTGATTERIEVVRAAGQFWGDRLVSSVPIDVDLEFISLSCTATGGSLGSAGPTGSSRNFTNAPMQNVFYPIAIGNSFVGTDANPSTADILARFNNDIDNNQNCLANVNWGYTISLTTNSGEVNFYTTLLHELAHGLGFTSTLAQNGTFFVSNGVEIPDSFSVHLYDESQNALLTALTVSQRMAALINEGQLSWNGSNVNNNSSNLTVGRTTSNRVRMFAPSPYEAGSSTAHFDTVLNPDELMEPLDTPMVSTALTEFMMQDVGWRISNVDSDSDGVLDAVDNCVNTANADQANNDNDSQGDVCDSDDDNDGITDVFENANNLDPLNAADASLDSDSDGFSNLEEFTANTNPQSATDFPFVQQIVEITGPSAIVAGSTNLYTVNYNVNNGDNTLSGISLRFHFNRAVFSLSTLRSVLATGRTSAPLVVETDSQDFDNNTETDSFIAIGWQLVTGNWPGVRLPQTLFSPELIAPASLAVGTTTTISITASSQPQNVQFVSTPTVVTVVSANWDLDGNNNADALTDGLLYLRYLFGFRGDTLINGAVASNATRTAAADIEMFASQLSTSIGDIDGNGNADALTDGLLLLRYLFGFRGDTLINGAVASGATRATAAQIEAHIQTFIP